MMNTECVHIILADQPDSGLGTGFQKRPTTPIDTTVWWRVFELWPYTTFGASKVPRLHWATVAADALICVKRRHPGGIEIGWRSTWGRDPSKNHDDGQRSPHGGLVARAAINPSYRYQRMIKTVDESDRTMACKTREHGGVTGAIRRWSVPPSRAPRWRTRGPCGRRSLQNTMSEPWRRFVTCDLRKTWTGRVTETTSVFRKYLLDMIVVDCAVPGVWNSTKARRRSNGREDEQNGAPTTVENYERARQQCSRRHRSEWKWTRAAGERSYGGNDDAPRRDAAERPRSAGDGGGSDITAAAPNHRYVTCSRHSKRFAVFLSFPTSLTATAAAVYFGFSNVCGSRASPPVVTWNWNVHSGLVFMGWTAKVSPSYWGSSPFMKFWEQPVL